MRYWGAYAFALGLGVDQLLAEVLPVRIGRGLLHDDLLVIVRELEDNEFVHFVELQLVVAVNALRRDGGSVWAC
jgi:hypothetical protein